MRSNKNGEFEAKQKSWYIKASVRDKERIILQNKPSESKPPA
jgi:hypothetical protein